MKNINAKKVGVFYYLLLLIVLTTWADTENLPPISLRLIFMVAVLMPLWINKSHLLPEVFFTFVVISASSFAVSYMPVDGLYVFITMLVSVVVLGNSKVEKLEVPLSFKMLCLLSLFIDLFFSSSLVVTFSWLSIIVVGESLFDCQDYKRVQFMAFSFAIISLVLSLEFIFVGGNFITSVNTLDGDLARKGWTDPNYFGSIIGMGILTSLIELITNEKLSRKSRLLYCSTIILSLFTLFTTASRGAVVALGCSSLILLWVAPIKKTYRLGIIFICLIVLFLMYELHMLDLLILRFQSDAGDAGGRTEIWIPRINAFFNDCTPLQWIFGLGTDEAMKLGTNQFIGFHNDYLSILVKYGFIGFFCLIGLLLNPFISCRKNKGIVFSGLVYIALCMFSIEPFTGGQWGCLYFYLYILILSQVRYEKQI